jgi:transketolase
MSVEAYSTFGWGAYSHDHFGLKSWGASGPYNQVYEKFGLTPSGIAQRGQKVVDFYKKRGHPVYSPLISALDEISE